MEREDRRPRIYRVKVVETYVAEFMVKTVSDDDAEDAVRAGFVNGTVNDNAAECVKRVIESQGVESYDCEAYENDPRKQVDIDDMPYVDDFDDFDD